MLYTAIAIGLTPVILISIYGIEDKNKEFFDKVHYETDYQAEVKRHVCPCGLMVPHWAMIGVVSIVLGLIITIIGVGIHEHRQARDRLKANATNIKKF